MGLFPKGIRVTCSAPAVRQQSISRKIHFTMFAKIVIGACIVAVARAGLLAEPGIPAYAAPAYASYAAPALAQAYTAQAYGGYGYGSHYADHALAHTSENTYRSPGNLHTVSTQSRTIATPYSSSNKHFTKITNPGIYAYAAPITTHTTYAHAAPIAHHVAPLAVAAPIAHAGVATSYASHHGSLGYAAGGHNYGHSASLLGTAYSPAVGVSHVSYSSPIGINYGY